MEFREVMRIDDQFEADLIEEALEEEQIPYRIQKFSETALDPIFSLQRGWGALLGLEADADRIRAVVEQVLRARTVSPGEETPTGEDTPVIDREP